MKPIWVVDDDQSIRFVLEKALVREQFSVRTFANPREVMKALDEDAAAVGLDVQHRFATWHLAPWVAEADWAVTVLRRPADT